MAARIQGNQRKGAGWPAFTGSEVVAAAGVRARGGKQLGGARERKDRGGGGEAHRAASGGLSEA